MQFILVAFSKIFNHRILNILINPKYYQKNLKIIENCRSPWRTKSSLHLHLCNNDSGGTRATYKKTLVWIFID